MAIVTIHPQAIDGKFSAGFALDLQTTSSTPLGNNAYGYMQYDTVRPEIAQLLYQLKYKGDRNAATPIIETAANFLLERRGKFDLIIPVPPSTWRVVQPVLVLAEGIGAALQVPVVSCITTTRPTTQLKEVTDPDQRMELLDGLYAVDQNVIRDKRVLLFDDLFRSGSTMNAITDVLLSEGRARTVLALTITRTRSNR